MSKKSLTVICSLDRINKIICDKEDIIIKKKEIYKYLFRYKDVKIIMRHNKPLTLSFRTLFILRLLSRGRLVVKNEETEEKNISVYMLIRSFFSYINDLFTKSFI